MSSTARRPGAISQRRLAFAGLLSLVYAAPLFWPPGPVPPGTVTGANAWLLERIIPGVPPLWVAVRLAALAAAAMLLSGGAVSALRRPFRAAPSGASHSGIVLRLLALAFAVVQAGSAPGAFRLGPAGQTAYLLALFVPALLLALPAWARTSWRPGRWRRAAPVAAVIALWIVLRLVGDLDSPRVADVVDGWLGFVATASFVAEHKNVLTDVYDAKLAGVGGVIAFFHGAPLFQLGFAELTFRRVQVLQTLWLAASAAGLALLTRALVGRGVSLIAVAVFLFSPYTRFVSLFPGPFLVGPLYSIALALLTVIACRRRSEAALAALGACAGIGITFPGVVPVVALFGAVTAWSLLRHWRRLWIGAAAGLASFAAAALPLFPNVLTPEKILGHVRWEGAAALNDAALIGQISLRSYNPLVAHVVARPLDIVTGAFLAPFAHPRFAVRLWGDAIFDPVGAALVAVGLAACVRSARGSATARFLLLFLVVALSPAFLSPVDVVDITHALVLPVPVALLAAAGFAALARQAGWTRRGRQWTVAVGTAAVCLGGTALFDVVTPRVVSASSSGIMFRVVEPGAVDRVVLVDYASDVIPNARNLYQEAIARYGGKRPVGYLEYEGGRFPRRDLPAEGKDLLFWSYALDRDYELAAAICRRWPDTTLYEIWDEARLGRAYAARLGGPDWQPRAAPGTWRSWDCAAERDRPRELRR